MQRHLPCRSTLKPLHSQWPPPALLRGARKPLHYLKSSANDASQQTSTSTSSSSSGAATAGPQEPSTVTVVEPTVLEPGTEPAESEAGTSGVEEEVPIYQNADFPEVPASANRAASMQYGALGAAYAIASGALAAAALRAPGALLPAADPWGSTLLGCLAATYLRAAGVFLHLKVATDNDELLCWRHQRLALVTAAYAAIALLSQAFGAASLQLAGLQALLSVASVAVVANVARSAWAVRPFVVTVVERAQGSLSGLVGALWEAALASVSTVAGVMLLALTAASLYGFAGIVFAPTPSPPTPLGTWPGQEETVSASAAGLRRLVGAGLLLMAAQAHALLDFAAYVQRGVQPGDLEGIKALMVEYLVRTKEALHKYFLPSPWLYKALNASFVAAAALQAFFVLRAPALGADVNWDGALWGPLYGTSALTAVYALIVMLSVDWRSVTDTVLRFFIWAGDMVLDFFNTFVWKFEWAERKRRV